MRLLLNRLLQGIVLLVGVALLNFMIFQLSPGDASNLYFGTKTKIENLRQLQKQRGVDKPWYEQFVAWSINVFHGDLGHSWAKHRPVKDVINEAIPATLLLTGVSLFIMILFGCLWGIAGGILADEVWGKLSDYASLIVYATPVFLLALLCIDVFCLRLQWLPASGIQSLFASELTGFQFISDKLKHLILPVLILGVTGAAAVARYVHAHMRDILRRDFITFAKAKGLSVNRVYFKHAFKNALLPVVTLFGIYFPFLISGAFIVEVIFSWPGIGQLTYEAVLAKDYPVLIMMNFIAAIMVIAGNLISDIIYRLIDPRIRIND